MKNYSFYLLGLGLLMFISFQLLIDWRPAVEIDHFGKTPADIMGETDSMKSLFKEDLYKKYDYIYTGGSIGFDRDNYKQKHPEDKVYIGYIPGHNIEDELIVFSNNRYPDQKFFKVKEG